MDEGVASGPSRRPANFVAGVIDDLDELERAVEEIVVAGVPRESIGLLQGERGAEGIAHRHKEGFAARLHRVAELFSDEREYVEHYQREARQGHFVVGVPLPDASQATRDRIHDILRAHGAHSTTSSGPWTHTFEE